MKSIYNILFFSIFLLSPLVASALCTDINMQNQVSCENPANNGVCIWDGSQCTERCSATNGPNCNQTPGCAWGDYGCKPCNPGPFNPGGSGSAGCDECNSTNNPFYLNDHMLPLSTSSQTYAQSSCPWICEAGYYRGGLNNDQCIQCPQHSNNCDGSGLNYNDVTCQPPYQPAYDPNTYTVRCILNCDSNALYIGETCKCNADYYGNGTTCAPCPANSTTDGATGVTDISGCNCQKGYYGNGATVCTACPYGTTTTSVVTTTTDISTCIMDSSTQFCDGTGNNCMNLIPSGVGWMCFSYGGV